MKATSKFRSIMGAKLAARFPHTHHLTLDQKYLVEIFTGPETPRKVRQAARVERRLRHEYGFKDTEPVDWEADFPWDDPAFWNTLMKILQMLAPFLLLIL